MAASEPQSLSLSEAPPLQPGDAANRIRRLRRRLGSFSVTIAILLLAGAVVVLFITRWDVWVGAITRQTTDDAYVRSDITPLSAKIEGYIRRVPVNDFQQVKHGELLVEVEDDDYRARLGQAEAELAGAEAAIENLKSRKALQHTQIAEAQDAVNAIQADVDRTHKEAVRQRALLASTFGTPQKVEQAVADERRFLANLGRSEAALAAAQRQMAVLDTEEAQLRAAAKANQAASELAKIELGYTRITAPIDGMVSERGVRAGQYPGVVVSGSVDSISPASGSQFTLLPPDNATGNFTKVVQRIPVKIALDPGNPLEGQLRPGMSVITTIRTDTGPETP